MGKLKKPQRKVKQKNKKTDIKKTEIESKIKRKSIKKQDKMLIKKKCLIKKIAAIEKGKQEEVAKKKRERTKITGDLRPLKDALPSIDELYTFSRTELKTGIKEIDKPIKFRNIKEKIRHRKKEYLERYKTLQSLMEDPSFKKNPRETIAAYVKSIAEENKL